MNKAKFKCRLKVILAEREIGHGEFAERIGLSPAAISSLSNNHSLPSFPVTYAICEELQLPLQEIWIKGTE